MNGGKTHCGNTVRVEDAAGASVDTAKGWMDQASVWARAARRQGDALARAAAAVEVLQMIWDRLTEEQKEHLADDMLLRERLRFVTGYYGYTCT